MSILYEDNKKLFTLTTKNVTYTFFINENNILEHLYYGPKINEFDLKNLNSFKGQGWSSHYLNKDNSKEEIYENFYKESALYEFGNTGTIDKKISPLLIKDESNSYFEEFKYVSHKIEKFNKEPGELPEVFNIYNKEAYKLEIILKDEFKDVELTLSYIVFKDVDTIVRGLKIKSLSKELRINRASTLSIDLPNDDFNYMHFHGDWSLERHIEKGKINHGYNKFSSFAGRSGHEENPSLIIFNKDTTEFNGNCFAVNVLYSGNFMIGLNLDKFETLRIIAGINDEALEIPLNKNEEIVLPEVILTFSESGFNDLSNKLHNFIKNHIIRSKFVNLPRPILLNSWEGFYMDFNTEKVIDYIENSKKIGNELFVLDDGWFLNRNDDSNGLGDWEIDESKIDLDKVIKSCKDNNLKFGLWFEPEMINPGTKLYKDHPEFALNNKNYNATLYRHQLMLDMSNDKVIDYLFSKIDAILEKYDIDYVKWDHNRHMSDIFSAIHPNISEGYLAHLCTIGTYKLFNKLTSKHKDVLFEGCASGGGRFDLGMLYYTPQIWCSDETDPIQRTFIQYGTSFIYPLSSIGAHVSKNPITSYKTKAAIAFFGTYGFEFDPSKLAKKDIEEIKEINEAFKEFHFDTIINGDSYRLLSPFETNYFSMQAISKDKKKAVFIFLNYKKENPRYRFIKLHNLNKDYMYELSNGEVLSGENLMKIGINLTHWIDEFHIEFITLKAKS